MKICLEADCLCLNDLQNTISKAHLCVSKTYPCVSKAYSYVNEFISGFCNLVSLLSPGNSQTD